MSAKGVKYHTLFRIYLKRDSTQSLMYTTPKRTLLKNLFSLKFCGTVVFYFAPLSFSILPYDRMTVAIAWYKEPIKMVYSVSYGMNIKQNDSSEMKTSLSPSKGKPISRQ